MTPRSFGGSGRAASVARDTWWYYAGLPRSARGLDVLHCTTFRGPLRASVPFAVTLHDLALVRHPELFPRWHRLSGRAGIGPRRAGGATGSSPSPSSPSARPSSCWAWPRSAWSWSGTRSSRVFSAGRARRRGRLRARGRRRWSRARTSAGPPRRPRAAGVELRVVGARGWGGVETPGWVGEVSDEELAALYRGARVRSSSRRCTRASASRCSRRWRAARRSSRAGAARPRRSPAARPCSSIRSTSRRSRPGSRRPRRAARSCVRSGSSGRATYYLGGSRRRRRARLAGAHVTPARRRRRRRARPQAHGRRDVRRSTSSASWRRSRRRPGLRIAAVTRHPELVPAGDRGGASSGRRRRSCGWR